MGFLGVFIQFRRVEIGKNKVLGVEMEGENGCGEGVGVGG